MSETAFFFSLLSLALSPFLLLAAQCQEMGGAWMPGSIRMRHPRPREAGTKASWQEFLHWEPRACGTSSSPPKKSTSDTARSGKLPRQAQKRPMRLKHMAKKKDKGRGKKPQDPSLHRGRLNKRPGEVDYFFSALPMLLFPPSHPSPPSSCPPSLSPSHAAPASRQK